MLLAAAGGVDRALGVVTAQRTALIENLQGRRRLLRAASRAADAEHPDDPGVSRADATRSRDAAHSDSLARALVLDALVVRAEAELRWLDQCEARLLSRRNGGSPTRRST